MNAAQAQNAAQNANIPFSHEAQLCKDLVRQGNQIYTSPGVKVPSRLPGQPNVSLDDAAVRTYLKGEFLTPLLDKMEPYMWLLATQSSLHISALHDQVVRGRKDIVITENPELHLVWIDSRVFVKPLPPYLLSYPFWDHYLFPDAAPVLLDEERTKLAQAALGFIRSYACLIRHESDFRMAQKAQLIPSKLSWPAFVRFISSFGTVQDSCVSARYQYGELRLSRLNFWGKFVLGRWQFHKPAWSYGEYFARYYAPILFIFGAFSIVLSAMQVGLAANPSWDDFQAVCAWFSVVTMLIVLALVMIPMAALCFMSMREVVFAIRAKIK